MKKFDLSSVEALKKTDQDYGYPGKEVIMKDKQETAVTLNGIHFAPAMMETLKNWYSFPPDEYVPCTMIACLENVQRHLIELSELYPEKDDKTMKSLRHLLYVIDQVKPFTEGGAV